jgi:hypothetical protein
MRTSIALLVISIFSIGAFSHSAPAAIAKSVRRQTTADWQFETRRRTYDTPDTRIYLKVNGRRIFILRASSEFSILAPGDYKTHDVPAGAIAACTGWWAGQGQDLYVVRRKNQLLVYVRYEDEEADLPGYRRLKVIPLGRQITKGLK